MVEQVLVGVRVAGHLEYQCPDLAERGLAGLVNGVNQAGASHQDLFKSAASPGISGLTLVNAHSASHEEYVMALAEERPGHRGGNQMSDCRWSHWQAGFQEP